MQPPESRVVPHVHFIFLPEKRRRLCPLEQHALVVVSDSDDDDDDDLLSEDAPLLLLPRGVAGTSSDVSLLLKYLRKSPFGTDQALTNWADGRVWRPDLESSTSLCASSIKPPCHKSAAHIEWM